MTWKSTAERGVGSRRAFWTRMTGVFVPELFLLQHLGVTVITAMRLHCG